MRCGSLLLRTPTLRRSVRRSCLTAIIGGTVAINCSSCERDGSSDSDLVVPFVSNIPAKIMTGPSWQPRDARSGEVGFSVNQSGIGAVVVTEKRLDVSYATNDLDASGGSVFPFEFGRGLQTVVSIKELKPEQIYFANVLLKRMSSGRYFLHKTIKIIAKNRPASSIYLTPIKLNALEGVRWTFDPALSAHPARIKLVAAPKFLNLDPISGVVSGIPDSHSYKNKMFRFELHFDEGGVQREQAYLVGVAGDPLFEQSWHLENRGQTSFAFFAGSYGFDARISAVHAQGLTGAGVKIRLIDSGVQLDHPDLKANMEESGHVNYETSQIGGGCEVCDPKNPTPPMVPGGVGDHGTAMAGIIAASGWNGIGSRGVAPNAKIEAHNVYAPRIKRDESMLLETLAVGTDIVITGVSSVDPEMETNQKIDLLYESLQNSSIYTGRGGKGTVYIRNAGDQDALRMDANFNAYNSQPSVMVIGAIGAHGRKAQHSESGSNLWVAAPGGDRGFQSEFSRMAEPRVKQDHYPALVSTDLLSEEFPCQVGFSKKPMDYLGLGDLFPPEVHSLGRVSGFEFGYHNLNEDCGYTAAVGGSGAAAAVTAGVVALMLEANPTLSWRDVRHILAKTARKIDANIPTKFLAINGHSYPRLAAWIKNGGGYNFHNSYGFGLLDAEKAVAMANPATYEPLPGSILTIWQQGGAGGVIGSNEIAGLTQSFPFTDQLMVEAVQVKLNISHENVSHLGIELTSPTGTRSILLGGQSGASHKDFKDMIFLTNAFYGEGASGQWSLHVVDTKGGRPDGQLQNWSIRFLGHYR